MARTSPFGRLSAEPETGDITLATALTYTNSVARTLTLQAAHNVILNADILPSISGGSLNLSFSGQTGHVAMGPGVTLNSNGGTITFSGASAQSLQGTIDSGGGAVTVGQGLDLAGDLTVNAGAGGVAISGSVGGAHDLVLDARGGAVSITGSVGNPVRLTESASRRYPRPSPAPRSPTRSRSSSPAPTTASR